MTCSSCTHWDRYRDSDLSQELGDCRLNPPTISETLLQRLLPGLSTPLADHDDLAQDIYAASAFPITHATSECGKHLSRMPLC